MTLEELRKVREALSEYCRIGVWEEAVSIINREISLKQLDPRKGKEDVSRAKQRRVTDNHQID